MKQQINASAAINGRSMNAEILVRLLSSFFDGNEAGMMKKLEHKIE